MWHRARRHRRALRPVCPVNRACRPCRAWPRCRRWGRWRPCRRWPCLHPAAASSPPWQTSHRAINFILESLHIDPRRFWELLDQVGASAGKLISSGLSIARKLISGTAKGVENFFANFGQHAKEGVYTWLFGDLAINWDLIPARWDDWSGWAEFFADLVGLSWDKILTAAQTPFSPEIELVLWLYQSVADLVDKGWDAPVLAWNSNTPHPARRTRQAGSGVADVAGAA